LLRTKRISNKITPPGQPKIQSNKNTKTGKVKTYSKNNNNNQKNSCNLKTVALPVVNKINYNNINKIIWNFQNRRRHSSKGDITPQGKK
jgi:hypothetical protein